MARLHKSSWFERLKRVARYRLHIPMKRCRHAPEHVARGVMVGVICAMTPFFGAQMLLVLAVWIIARNLFTWDFSLVNGLAWTWSTNVFTVIPAYYLFWLTGQVFLGRFDDLTGYDSFKSIFDAWNASGTSYQDAVSYGVNEFFWKWAVPLSIGCVPWAVLSGWLSYRLSLQFVTRYRHQRALRMASRQGEAPQTPSLCRPQNGPSGMDQGSQA